MTFTPPQLLWEIIALVALVGNAILIVRQLMGRHEEREITNNPLVVAAHPEFVSRRECGLHHAGFEARLSHLERRFELLQGDIKKEACEMRDAIANHHAEIMRALGRLEGR